MFEKISFLSMQFDHSVNRRSADHMIQTVLGRDLYQYSKKNFDSVPYDVEFSLQGSSKSLFPGPISIQEEKDFLTMQVFSLFQAGSSYYTKRKDYPSYLLTYTYEGLGLLTLCGKTYKLPPKTGFLIDCRTYHEYRTASDSWKFGQLHFHGHNADRFYGEFYKDESPIFTLANPAAFQETLEKLLYAYQQIPASSMLVRSCLLETLLLTVIQEKYTQEADVPEYIRYLCHYLENNLEKQFSLDEIASFCNRSKYHLSREFKRFTGFSIHQYLLSLRISRARFLLQNTELPAETISDLLGFSNYSNFYKQFLAQTGKTPREYRGMHG